MGKAGEGFLYGEGEDFKEANVARIAEVNIPTNKRVTIALRYIHGIGPAKAAEICEKVGIAAERRVTDLTDQEILKIRETIDACLLYTSPSPRDQRGSRMPSSA